MAKIILDAGRGGANIGGIFQNRFEKDDNLRLTLAVGEILENKRFEVAYTRSSDIDLTPLERVRIANEEGGDLYVSFHRSTSPFPDALYGVQALVYSFGGINETAGVNITNSLQQIGFNNNGVESGSIHAILRDTDMPAVRVEVGFINSSLDNQLFDNRFYDIANAIAIGIANTFQTVNRVKSTNSTRSFFDRKYYHTRNYDNFHK